MSYLTDFGDKLLSLLVDVPEEKRSEIASFMQNAVYQRYKTVSIRAKSPYGTCRSAGTIDHET